MPPAMRSHADVYDINKKTGALILGKNRLDDYAEKYLTEHYPNCLLYTSDAADDSTEV